MTSPNQCPKCQSTNVGSRLEWHLEEYSWWKAISCVFWIVLIPFAIWILVKRFDERPEPEERICLNCQYTWGGEDDEDDEDD